MAKHVLRIGAAGPLIQYRPKEPWTSHNNPYERHAYLLGLRAGARDAAPLVMVAVRYAAAWHRGFSEGCGVRRATGSGRGCTENRGIVTIVMLPRPGRLIKRSTNR